MTSTDDIWEYRVKGDGSMLMFTHPEGMTLDHAQADLDFYQDRIKRINPERNPDDAFWLERREKALGWERP